MNVYRLPLPNGRMTFLKWPSEFIFSQKVKKTKRSVRAGGGVGGGGVGGGGVVMVRGGGIEGSTPGGATHTLGVGTNCETTAPTF